MLSLTAVVRSWGTCCAWLIDVGYADIRLPVERSPRTRRPRRLEIQGCGISRDGAPPGDGDRAGGVVYVVDDPVVAHPDPQSGPVSL